MNFFDAITKTGVTEYCLVLTGEDGGRAVRADTSADPVYFISGQEPPANKQLLCSAELRQQCFLVHDLKIPPSIETRTKLECHMQLLFRHSIIVARAVVVMDISHNVLIYIAHSVASYTGWMCVISDPRPEVYILQ